MGELLWADVREWFDPEVFGNEMPLHDACVLGEVPDAWRAVADLVSVRGWRSELNESVLHVWPADGFLVNFFEFGWHDVAFDIDTRELQGQQRIDLLSAFMRELGQAFRLPVALAFEGVDPAVRPYLHYDPVVDGFVLDWER